MLISFGQSIKKIAGLSHPKEKPQILNIQICSKFLNRNNMSGIVQLILNLKQEIQPLCFNIDHHLNRSFLKMFINNRRNRLIIMTPYNLSSNNKAFKQFIMK